MKTSYQYFSIGEFYNVEGEMVVQVRQEPHEVLLPAPGVIQAVTSDKGKPAGKPRAQRMEKRAAMISLEKDKEESCDEDGGWGTSKLKRRK